MSLREFGTFGDIVEQSRMELLDGYIQPRERRQSKVQFGHGSPDIIPMIIKYQQLSKRIKNKKDEDRISASPKLTYLDRETPDLVQKFEEGK